MVVFLNQTNALFRKNLILHRNHIRSHLRLVLYPVILFVLLALAKHVLEKAMVGHYEEAVVPDEYPPLLQIPSPEYRAVRSSSFPFEGLPDDACRKTGTCPVTMFITGENRTFGEGVVSKMFLDSAVGNFSDQFSAVVNGVFGTNVTGDMLSRFSPSDPAFEDNYLFQVQAQCSNSTFTLNSTVGCVEALSLWRSGSLEIKHELYDGYRDSNKEGNINGIMGAIDLQNSDIKNFNVQVWYNATYKGITRTALTVPNVLRVAKVVDMVSNAYLQYLHGPATKMICGFVTGSPRPQTVLNDDIITALLPILFTWLILQLFPVLLQSLVYEKQQKLKMMMKMHGLGYGPHFMITYLYFLIISTVYICCFVGVGSLIGLPYFTLNSYSVQLIFYFIYINLQIAMSFILSVFFQRVKTASVVGFFMVFGTGLLGATFFKSCVDNALFPGTLVIVLELYPGFSLYRGLDELAGYTSGAIKAGTHGIEWRHLRDSASGMREVLIIMIAEWFVFLFLAWFMDQLSRSPLFAFLQCNKPLPSSKNPSHESQEARVLIHMETDDVAVEAEKVTQLLNEPNSSYSIICHNLQKIYPGKDGNPDKFAVRGVNLALPRGECFGLLGPNGAGKTTFISMMTGLTDPSSGMAYIEGLNLRRQMDRIYNIMGICPQFNLLWDPLTGREHLLFYGRLKNLSGSALINAVNDSLTSVDLLDDADKEAGKYSGGMKRRLSVAISLIGNPKVVYLDEPSTGLDPASRNKLWDVVSQAKKDRTIILTTHSMEEAEYLCDRIGIFVDGKFQCLGSPDELKARYGGSYLLTITTSERHEMEVENLVKQLSSNAKKTYTLSGTQKFELSKHEVKISEVFRAVKFAKQRFPIQTWGITETTLEDVFIKVAMDAGSLNT